MFTDTVDDNLRDAGRCLLCSSFLRAFLRGHSYLGRSYMLMRYSHWFRSDPTMIRTHHAVRFLLSMTVHAEMTPLCGGHRTLRLVNKTNKNTANINGNRVPGLMGLGEGVAQLAVALFIFVLIFFCKGKPLMRSCALRRGGIDCFRGLYDARFTKSFHCCPRYTSAPCYSFPARCRRKTKRVRARKQCEPP